MHQPFIAEMISPEVPVSDRPVDPDLLAKKQGLIVGYGVGAHVSAMIYVGIELGLYAALREGGGATPPEFAERTGLHERWLREWLQQQASSGLLDYDAETKRFAIAPEVWILIGDPDELRTLRTNFAGLTYRFGVLDRLPEAFRTGIGVRWDDRGPRAAESTELLFRNWYRQVLVPQALPKLEGVTGRLQAGGVAADVGCESGHDSRLGCGGNRGCRCEL